MENIDVPVKMEVVIGSTVLPISEIRKLSIGSVIDLDKLAGEHVDIMANGVKIASGEIVVINEHYGVRIL